MDDTGGWIIFSFTVIIPIGIVLLSIILKVYKKMKARFFVRRFAEQDPIWNETAILNHTRSMFNAVNDAWLNMNFIEVMPRITDDLKLEWIQILKIMESDKLLYSYSSVQIDAIEIIGAYDDVDNNRDLVQVRISGYMRRHFRNSETNELTRFSSPGFDFFADLYTFNRCEDVWLLDKIEYFAGFTKIMLSTIKGYQPPMGNPRLKEPGRPRHK
jgi:hypothetical protein